MSNKKKNHKSSNSEEGQELTLGTFLKKGRESQGKGVEQIAYDTKINPSLLVFLEEEQLDKLPGKAYVHGFVRSYCQCLGLNSETGKELLNKAYGDEGVQEESAPLAVAPPEEGTGRSLPVNIPAVSAFIIMILVVIFYFVFRPSEEESAASTTKNETSTLPKALSNKEKKIVPPNEKLLQNEVKPGPVEKKVAKTPTKEATKNLPKKAIPLEKVKAPSEKKEKREEKKEEKSELRPLPSPLFTYDEFTENDNGLIPSNIKEAMNSSNENVFINAVKGDTWLTYKKDDQAIRKFVLKQGRTILIRGKLVRVFIGNVHVTRIFHNNRPLKIISKSGVKSLVFPIEKATSFRIPLFIYNKDGSVSPSTEEL